MHDLRHFSSLVKGVNFVDVSQFDCGQLEGLTCRPVCDNDGYQRWFDRVR
jgi:hypothetical protein